MGVVSQQGFLKRYLFQIYLEKEQIDARLKYTEEYSQDKYNESILNCANLSLVILGLVKPEYYLESCTKRKTGTDSEELVQYMGAALRQCGNDAKIYSSDLIMYSEKELKNLIEAIYNEYATGFIIKWNDDTAHMIVMGKHKNGTPYILDPQISNEDGSYPFKKEGFDTIDEYFKDKVKGFYYIHSPFNIAISKTKSLDKSCLTDLSPMMINNPNEPKRKMALNKAIKQEIKKLLAKSKKKKQKKSSKKISKRKTLKQVSNAVNNQANNENEASRIFNMWVSIKEKQRKANISRRKSMQKISRKARQIVAAKKSMFPLTKKRRVRKTFVVR